MIDSLIDEHGAVDRGLLCERRVVACVEVRDRPAGAVTVRAVRIQAGARPILEAATQDRPLRASFGEARDLVVAEAGTEEAEVTPGAQLIVGDAGGIVQARFIWRVFTPSTPPAVAV